MVKQNGLLLVEWLIHGGPFSNRHCIGKCVQKYLHNLLEYYFHLSVHLLAYILVVTSDTLLKFHTWENLSIKFLVNLKVRKNCPSDQAPHHEDTWWTRGKAPCILSLGIRWREEMHLRFWQLLNMGPWHFNGQNEGWFDPVCMWW